MFLFAIEISLNKMFLRIVKAFVSLHNDESRRALVIIVMASKTYNLLYTIVMLAQHKQEIQ